MNTPLKQPTNTRTGVSTGKDAVSIQALIVSRRLRAYSRARITQRRPTSPGR